jgi:hypothetical protein
MSRSFQKQTPKSLSFFLPDAPTRLFPRALQKDWGSEVPQALSSSSAILGNWAMQGASDFASALLQSIAVLAIRTTKNSREKSITKSRSSTA